MLKHKLDMDNVENHDQIMIVEDGGIITTRARTLTSPDESDVFVRTLKETKVSHTVHLVTHSRDLYRFCILVTKLKIPDDHPDFIYLPKYSATKGGITCKAY